MVIIMMMMISVSTPAITVDSRHPNTSVISTKADQRITVTTQADVKTHDRRHKLEMASSTDNLHSSQLGCMSDWLVSSTMQLRITSRPNQGTSCSGISGLMTGSSARVVKLGITLSLNGGVMFDASLHADIIRRSHSGGSRPSSI